jgi:D-arabinose 1-dehydrogenase-like Zn-dependent alcohol dehydrogenase
MSKVMLAGGIDVITRKFAIESIPLPEPGPEEVRIKVSAAGICLSDVHTIEGTLRPIGRGLSNRLQ